MLPIVAGALLAAAAGTTVWSLRSAPPPEIVRFSIPLGEGQQFTNIGRRVLDISPDGKRIVYVANRKLYLRSLSDLTAKPIPGTESAATAATVSPVFSPDGRSVAKHSGPREATAFDDGRHWCADRRTIEVGPGGGLMYTIRFARTYSMSSPIREVKKGNSGSERSDAAYPARRHADKLS